MRLVRIRFLREPQQGIERGLEPNAADCRLEQLAIFSFHPETGLELIVHDTDAA
jgi:hypothetical protein